MDKTSPLVDFETLASRIEHAARPGDRLIVGIAGPPGAGKSTLAARLLERLASSRPGRVAIVPMDGFHYDNAVLRPAGLLPRKGAPRTFDAAGFAACLQRIRARQGDVAVPVFDRAADLARAGAAIIDRDCEIVLVEGNYLLLDEAEWRCVRGALDLSLFIRVDRALLRERLVQRWLDHGLDEEAAIARAEGNDLANAELILDRSLPADLETGPEAG